MRMCGAHTESRGVSITGHVFFNRDLRASCTSVHIRTSRGSGTKAVGGVEGVATHEQLAGVDRDALHVGHLREAQREALCCLIPFC
jgi:hypothetical protein